MTSQKKSIVRGPPSYLPVLTICQTPGFTTCVQTTDPGRVLISRGLAARAPYFHNGSDSRFSIGFTAQEKADLIAFLGSL